jgi:hypothetical protein
MRSDLKQYAMSLRLRKYDIETICGEIKTDKVTRCTE